MPFYSLTQQIYREKRTGVYVKTISGAAAQLCMIRLLPGQTSGRSHAEEQLGYILSGRVAIKIGNEEKELGPGEAYLVPAHVDHAFRVVGKEPLEYLEVFCPPRSDNAL